MKTINSKLLPVTLLLLGVAILISSFKKEEEKTKEYLTVAFTRTGWEGHMTVIPRDGLPDQEEIPGSLKKDALVSNWVEELKLTKNIVSNGEKLQNIKSEIKK